MSKSILLIYNIPSILDSLHWLCSTTLVVFNMCCSKHVKLRFVNGHVAHIMRNLTVKKT